MSCLSAANAPAFLPQAKVALSPLALVGIVPRVARKSTRELRLRQLVEDNVNFVARILRNAGTAQADIDDDVQRVFIALSNRLDDVQVGAEKSFLLQTALHMAAHARRTAARRREVITDSPPELVDPLATPEELADRSQLRRTLDRILSMMETDLRVVFVLFEIEEMTTTEIAAALKIPAGTVASRLRRARVDFRDHVAMIENCQESEVG